MRVDFEFLGLPPPLWSTLKLKYFVLGDSHPFFLFVFICSNTNLTTYCLIFDSNFIHLDRCDKVITDYGGRHVSGDVILFQQWRRNHPRSGRTRQSQNSRSRSRAHAQVQVPL